MFRTQKPRRGVTAVLALLYLVLFASLAIGFYSATNTSAQVSANERRAIGAMIAAESGMEFIRYQLAQVSVPPKTPQAELFALVANALLDQMDGTPNLLGKTIAVSSDLIVIPGGANDFIRLSPDGAEFRCTIENLGQKLRVKVVGRQGNSQVRRAVQMDYDLAEKASQIFDFGVASRGKIVTGGSARIRGATDPAKGSVLSTNMTEAVPVSIQGKEVSGDISIVNPNGTVAIKNGTSVGGTTNQWIIQAQHVHKGVAEPEFPTIDTDSFAAYATNTFTSGMTNLTNIRIPANTNPKFTSNVTIQGVLYVETPNVVEFRGGVTIKGVIVTQNNPTGSLSTNILDFRGNVSAQGVESLPESFGDLRQLTGSFILADGFHTKFSGNFGTVHGSIIASKVSMTGNAQGTVMGTVINLQDTLMEVDGSAEIIIASTGTTNYPAGVFFSSRYVPLPDTYEEVLP